MILLVHSVWSYLHYEMYPVPRQVGISYMRIQFAIYPGMDLSHYLASERGSNHGPWRVPVHYLYICKERFSYEIYYKLLFIRVGT